MVNLLEDMLPHSIHLLLSLHWVVFIRRVAGIINFVQLLKQIGITLYIRVCCSYFQLYINCWNRYGSHQIPGFGCDISNFTPTVGVDRNHIRYQGLLFQTLHQLLEQIHQIPGLRRLEAVRQVNIVMTRKILDRGGREK